MKINRIHLLIVAISLFGANANAGYLSDLASQLKDKAASFICRKASAFDFKFSIRSFEGVACKVKEVGAIAELICLKNNYDNYAESGCHKNAVKAMGDQKPLEVLESMAVESAKIIAPAICMAATATIPVLEPACAVLGTALEVLEAPNPEAIVE